MSTIFEWAKQSYMKEERINYKKEIVMIFSNRKSLFSSKKIEKSIIFVTFLIITIIYIFRKFDTIETMDFIEILLVWLGYGGYNTFMSFRDKKNQEVKEE